jgi:hypothetical protein
MKRRSLLLFGFVAVIGMLIFSPTPTRTHTNPTPQPYHATPVNLGPRDPVVTAWMRPLKSWGNYSFVPEDSKKEIPAVICWGASAQGMQCVYIRKGELQ